ncbi:MAG: hypothetical protein KatS3mg055_1267 [Chloroflexus sp.]|uniref:DUF3800 domain-containing protein n=1 Tax=Chloroflexus sp. TaxID=1904827 RepID=UPI0021DCF632|nr:DUF3800 domain-containing protein [Chloroflexus sp.]GIV88749.1 MAG: hypothetical protein KatS3mg055_1267 [Chloroflexus sp.]
MDVNAFSTHIAYADESYYTKERYRSIAVVTFAAEHHDPIKRSFKECILSSGLKEFKWTKLRQARERFAALKIINTAIGLAVGKKLRIDVLIWDTQDDRHRIRGRDDIANLERMYYHLFKNVLQRRWPSESKWYLFPDENSALDWATVQDYLDSAGLTVSDSTNLFDQRPFSIRVSRDFQIMHIQEVTSASEPICQVADLFAGIGAYSYLAYSRYTDWLSTEQDRLSVGLDVNVKLSNSECERFLVIKYLNECCKHHKLRVGFSSSRGFRTYDPRFPVNFWLYAPQHSDDKAPVKAHSG